MSEPDVPRVAIGFVHPDVGETHSFLASLELLRQFDAQNLNVLRGRFEMYCGGGLGLVDARNMMAAKFVLSEDEWLLIIDTDMGFQPDALYRLLAVAHPEKRPIVGGLAFIARQVEEDGFQGFRVRPRPTLFDWREVDGRMQFWSESVYPVNTLKTVAATGSAFLLVHRSVYERIAEKYGPTWYDRSVGTDGKLMGEDVSFCMRAWDCGIPVMVHTGVRTTHFKKVWIGETDYWRSLNPPAATDEVAVIVPTHRRPQNAVPFMTSLRATTGLATVYAVVDADDPDAAQAWAEAGAEVIESPDVEFAKKANLGFGKTSQPWVFLVGDDVKFHDGWLNHAQHVANQLQASVVGTNDLGNAKVMAGDHATHLLIRRSYVEQQGGGWDGPGVLCHEGYRHWFVDNELVDAAKQRGVWQMALGSVVEHLHVLWGKAPDDEVYAIGPDNAEADQAVYLARREANR